ncbi:hypothetical protein [Nocardia sp. NRRL S-836]|uniref:hypothetical protein n=1 Tax=Nocardia sp. NRRL S-836 TaxID=1519492 RepID=UPI0006AE096F|nr:hypothetical protein [Nocardia sp. NRRL S-836]KOV84752.1 hypothetical protein ADL03_15930 [Nocardia sp. NRRL S-836]
MDTQTAHAPLTTVDVMNLASIVRAARAGSLVQRADDRAPDGRVVGTVRHLVTNAETCELLVAAADIRTSLLRATLHSGTDVFWPVPELLVAMTNGEVRFSN